MMRGDPFAHLTKIKRQLQPLLARMKRSQAKMDKIPAGNLLDPKWLSLSCFILQNSLLIIGLKACTINSSHSMNQYISSTAVILSELLKFALSTAACFVIDAKCNYGVFKEMVYNVLMEEGADAMKLCVPALLYTIQNNLQYIIEEAPLFLVLYQAKIITTAIFYSTLLSRRLSSKEWASVVALALGVSMVESSQVEIVPNHASNITGVVAVVFACLSSGVAGVSFEKILKSSRSSIWMINMQMSLLSAFFCTSVALTQDSMEIAHHGVFTGYNPLVILSIVLQAFTGLAVALVVKYADNIYKGFGHSLSVVFCTTLSSFVFEDTSVNETFLLGCFIVLASSVAYASMTSGGASGTKEGAGFNSTGNLALHSHSAANSAIHSTLNSNANSTGISGASSSIATSTALPQNHYNVINHNASLLMSAGNNNNNLTDAETHVVDYSDVESADALLNDDNTRTLRGAGAGEERPLLSVLDDGAAVLSSAPAYASNTDVPAVIADSSNNNISNDNTSSGGQGWVGGFWERMNRPTVSKRDT